LLIFEPKLKPDLIASSTARLFKIGSAPGIPVQTEQVFVFGSEPNSFLQEQKTFQQEVVFLIEREYLLPFFYVYQPI
jgi:hypothetical protein